MMTEEQKVYAELLRKKALDLGADDAVVFTIDQIVFDSRTLLKCMFGCSDWGKGPTCPSRPNYPTMVEMKEMFSRYSWGVIVHAHDKAVAQKASFALEREAFLDGYHFAFSLSDCARCAKCAGQDGLPCRDPKRARPAFHSVGIDVFSTVRALGLPLYPLRSEEDEQNWYSAVFVQ